MRLLTCLALTCLPLHAFASSSVAGRLVETCDDDLLARAPQLLEDPIAVAEMRDAREAAHRLAPHLAAWGLREAELKRDLVVQTLGELRRAGVEVDGSGVRSLFLVVQRYLVNTRDFGPRVLALADVLRLDVATASRLTQFFLSLDGLAYHRDIPAGAPKFLHDALDIKAFVRAELGAHVSAAARTFLERRFDEVVRQRLRYARLAMNPERTQLIVRTPVGVYRINLTDRVFERPPIAEPYVSYTDAWDRADDRVIHAHIEISTADGEAALFLRTAVRADPFLHPHASLATLKALPQATVLSDWQESEVVTPLLKLDEQLRKSHGHKGPILLGLQMPVGSGKTPSGIAYLNRVPVADKLQGVRAKHIVIVEHTHLLNQAMANYQRDTGARPDKMALIYGNAGHEKLKINGREYEIPRGRGQSPPMDWDVVFITRSSYIARRSTLAQAFEAENRKAPQARRPFRITIDEGQHVGTEDGDFEEIFEHFDRFLTKEDRVLVVSATLDHAHGNIIKDRLAGAVVAPLLLPDELAALRRGENVMMYARVQFIRAMLAGIINPIDPNSVAGRSSEHGGGFIDELKRGRRAAREMYAFVTELVAKTRPPGGGYDRGLVFEPEKDRATKGAGYLAELLKRDDDARVAWFAHSDLSTEEGQRRVRWLRGIEEFAGTGDGHKYLTSVSQFLEGIDVPEINLLVVMRNFQSLIAMMQLLGRGARIDAFKTSARLIDLPGLVMKWLEEADILWLRASSARADLMAGWDKPLLDPVELLDQPDSDLLTPSRLETRTIQLEPVYREERKRLAAWQEIKDGDLARASDAGDGALALLKRNPEDTEDLARVNPTAWFGYFYAQFPGEVRAEWFTHWQQLNLENRALDPNSLSASQRRAALRGFRLLGRMFNGLPNHRDRLGLADLEPDEELTRSGFARIRLGLKRRPVAVPLADLPEHVAPLSFRAADFAQTADLREGLREGLLFANSSPALHQEIAKQAKIPSAWAALGLVVRIVAERPALARLLGEYPGQLHDLVATARDPFAREVAATYALALITNVTIAESHLELIKPWDLHAIVGRRNGEDVLAEDVNAAPSFHDLVMTLDLADSRLGGATEAAVPPPAPVTEPELEPAAAATPPAPDDADRGPFKRADLERLTGRDGTLAWLQKTRGKAKLLAPEDLLARMINHNLFGPDVKLHRLRIRSRAEETPVVRLAFALVAAEDFYRSLNPRLRLGLPAPVARETFDAANFQRLVLPVHQPSLALPIAFDVASVNAHLPYRPLTEADRAELAEDPFWTPHLTEHDPLNEPETLLNLVLKILKTTPAAFTQAHNMSGLTGLKSTMTAAKIGADGARAYALGQLAWIINVLSSDLATTHPAWSLAALVPLPHQERVTENGTRPDIEAAAYLRALRETIRHRQPKPRVNMLTKENWSVVEPDDMLQARRLMVQFYERGVKTFDFLEFMRQRRRFNVHFEHQWQHLSSTVGALATGVSTNPGLISQDHLVKVIHVVRLLGAMFNDLSEIDRLGQPSIPREDSLSAGRLNMISKVFIDQFSATLPLLGPDAKSDRRVGDLSAAEARIWRERMMIDRLCGGHVSNEFVGWMLGGFRGTSAERMKAIADQLRSQPRLRELIGDENLHYLADFEAEIQKKPGVAGERALYRGLAQIANYLIRQAARDEQPWDLALDDERSPSDPRSNFHPTWNDFLRVLHRASLHPVDAALAAYGITDQNLEDFMNPGLHGASALTYVHRPRKPNGPAPELLWRHVFEDWSEALPPGAQSIFAARLREVNLPTTKTRVPDVDPDHARAIARGLLIFQEIFNGLDPVDRLGLPPLRPKAILSVDGVKQIVDFRNGYALRDIEDFSECRFAADLTATPGTKGPFAGASRTVDVLRILVDLARRTSNFKGRLDGEHVDFLEAVLGHIAREGDAADWESRAARSIARVVNQLIRGGHLAGVKPWDADHYSTDWPYFEPVDAETHNLHPTLDDLTAVVSRFI